VNVGRSFRPCMNHRPARETRPDDFPGATDAPASLQRPSRIPEKGTTQVSTLTIKSTIAALCLGLALFASPARAQDAAKIDAAKTAQEAAAHAEHGHETQELIAQPNQGAASAVTTLVVFGLVFAVLATAVWPKILKGLKDREHKIREVIESAEMARQQAKDALEQYQQSLAQARAEAAKMLETTRAQQAQLAAELKAKADTELAQLRERAMKDIDAAKRAAVSEIYNESGRLAATMAAKILRRAVNADDTQKLIDESIRELQASRN